MNVQRPIQPGGGTPLAAAQQDAVQVLLVTGAYADLPTPGPTVTLRTGTAVTIWMSAQTFVVGVANENLYIAVAVSGATTIAASDANGVYGANGIATAVFSLARWGLHITGLTPGMNTFTLKYKSAVGGASFGECTLAVGAL